MKVAAYLFRCVSASTLVESPVRVRVGRRSVRFGAIVDRSFVRARSFERVCVGWWWAYVRVCPCLSCRAGLFPVGKAEGRGPAKHCKAGVWGLRNSTFSGGMSPPPPPPSFSLAPAVGGCAVSAQMYVFGGASLSCAFFVVLFLGVVVPWRNENGTEVGAGSSNLLPC